MPCPMAVLSTWMWYLVKHPNCAQIFCAIGCVHLTFDVDARQLKISCSLFQLQLCLFWVFFPTIISTLGQFGRSGQRLVLLLGPSRFHLSLVNGTASLFVAMVIIPADQDCGSWSSCFPRSGKLVLYVPFIIISPVLVFGRFFMSARLLFTLLGLALEDLSDSTVCAPGRAVQ